MFAIIETGGKQYKVNEGDIIFIEKLDAAEGETVTFDRVMAISAGDAVKFGAPVVEGAKVTANVLKGCVIFISTPFALAVFMYNGQVDYVAGLVHAAGNILGAVMASHWAVSWGVKFVKWFTLFIIIVSFIDLVGLISLQDMLSSILN